MQRSERRLARDEGRAPRTLQEIDYLLGVTDIARMGALRFKRPGDLDFQAPATAGVPRLVQLGVLMDSALRVDREDAVDDALDMILAPGSSLGGARPKASVRSAKGELAMLQTRDGERGSYPEIVDELGRHGARARADAAELFRRMVFNILVSNVDDHLRNHGFTSALAGSRQHACVLLLCGNSAAATGKGSLGKGLGRKATGFVALRQRPLAGPGQCAPALRDRAGRDRAPGGCPRRGAQRERASSLRPRIEALLPALLLFRLFRLSFGAWAASDQLAPAP